MLVWEGEASALPEWTSGIDVEDDEERNKVPATLERTGVYFAQITHLL